MRDSMSASVCFLQHSCFGDEVHETKAMLESKIADSLINFIISSVFIISI